MKPNVTFRLLLGAFLVASSAAPTFADSSPEAQQWLEKLVSIYDRAPLTVEYVAELDMSSLGQPMAGSIKGSLAQADRTRSRTELELDMAGGSGVPEGGMTMSILVVSDGTTLWTEMDNPAMGGRQVTKMSLEVMEQMNSAALGVSPTSMDPVAQLEALTGTVDFELLERAGGKVTLEGKITDEARARLGIMAAPGVDGFVLVIDEKTGFPTEVRTTGETPFLTMRFSNLKFVDALADELFEYTPPEGLPVMDVGAMLQAQQHP